MHKVLIPTKLDAFAANLLRDNNYEVIQDSTLSIDELAKNNPNTEILIVRSEKVTSEIIDLLPQLKLVVRAGAGFNTIDTKYARQKNVDVMNTPGANSNAVAEEVVAMMLSAYRHVIAADASTRAGNWEKSKFMGRELTGKTIGILGIGNIGQLLIKRLSGFEMRILGYDPMLSVAKASELNVELLDVDSIFEQADFISLHIPENNETRGMINRRILEKMKPGAMLLNCARAGIINEEDLRAIKQEKKIIFCNDVYPKDIAGEKTVTDIADIMLPHLGANTFEANFVAAKRAAQQTIDYFEKGVTSCVVNKDLPDGLDRKYQKLAFVLTSLANAYLGEGKQPDRIETSFYGDLTQFSKWMLPPIAAGIAGKMVPGKEIADATVELSERGIEVKNREVDNSKEYGNAMSIDLFAGNDSKLYKSGVRGTITENHLIISRINDFDHLYLSPEGHHLFVEYQDEPGVIGKITGILGEKNINILDIRAPQDLKSGNSLTVVTTNIEVPDMLVNKIKDLVKASKAFQFSYNK